MKKRIIICGIIISLIHFVLTVGSVLIAFGAMDAFDNPDHRPTSIERVADRTAGVLMEPLISLWTPWMSEHMPDAVEWMLFIGNSLLWGLGIALLINARNLLSRKEADTRPSR